MGRGLEGKIPSSEQLEESACADKGSVSTGADRGPGGLEGRG